MKGKFKIITKVGTITNTALEWFQFVNTRYAYKWTKIKNLGLCG